MKLRILGDSIRLRLSQTDVQELGTNHRVEGRTHFAPGASPLVYSLSAAENVERVTASFEDGEIAIVVPADRALSWIKTDEVGIKAEQTAEAGRILRLLIEKDFKCVVPREGEEDYDGFPHPEVSC